MTQQVNPDDVDTGCIWDIVYKDEIEPSEVYERVHAGIVAVALACSTYLVCQYPLFRIRRKATDESYNLFSIFLFVIHFKALLPKICRFILYHSLSKYATCESCAAIETFFDIFQVELVTHMCVDRYVIAKYYNAGWSINKKYYSMYVILSLFFATLYGRLGSYGKDFNCETCAMEMVLKTDWTRYLALAIWFLRSIKPYFFTITMLNWTRQLDAHLIRIPDHLHDTTFSRFIEMIAGACFISSAPMCAVRGYVILNQLIRRPLVNDIPMDWISIATTISETGPIFVTVMITCTNRAIYVVEGDLLEQNKSD